MLREVVLSFIVTHSLHQNSKSCRERQRAWSVHDMRGEKPASASIATGTHTSVHAFATQPCTSPGVITIRDLGDMSSAVRSPRQPSPVIGS